MTGYLLDVLPTLSSVKSVLLNKPRSPTRLPRESDLDPDTALLTTGEKSISEEVGRRRVCSRKRLQERDYKSPFELKL